LIRNRIDEVREVLVEVGDPLLPFWITEVGYNIAFGQQDEAGQVAFMREVYAELGTRPDVAVVFWFKYEDFPPADGPYAQQWGVVRVPFTVGECRGGACYDEQGRPLMLRSSFWAYRELAGKADEQPEPPAYVALEGPATVPVSATVTYTATVSRPSATLPVTFTWERAGETVVRTSDTLTSTLTFSADRAGLHPLALEVTNAGGSVINTASVFAGQRLYVPLVSVGSGAVVAP
jgi:hypothetical protein